MSFFFTFFFQTEDVIRDIGVTGVQTCALPIYGGTWSSAPHRPGEPLSDLVHATAPTLRPEPRCVDPGSAPPGDRKSVVKGKSVGLGGRRIIKKNNEKITFYTESYNYHSSILLL